MKYDLKFNQSSVLAVMASLFFTGLAWGSSLPAVLASVGKIGTEVTDIRGVLLVKAITRSMGSGSVFEYQLQAQSGEKFQLQFSGTPGRLPLSGSEVLIKRALKVPVDSGLTSLIVENAKGGDGIQILKETITNAIGPQSTAFILVNFSDQPSNRPWSVGSVQKTFDYLSEFYYENSFNQTELTGDVLGWYTINLPSNNCNGDAIAEQADQAAAADGIVTSSYTHRVYIYPGKCDYIGWAYLGTPEGGSSRAFVNNFPNFFVIGHQFGHSLGVWNSNSFFCGSQSIGDQCQHEEATDPSDIMGYGYAGHINAFLKEQLGWLGDNASPPITEILTSQKIRLEPFETISQNAKALKVLKSKNSDSSSDFYYLEYRQPLGFDSAMPWPNFFAGVLIHQGNSKNMNSSHLLDMTPGDHNFTNAALLPGATFTDTKAGVSITLNAVSAAGADLTFTVPVKSRPTSY